MTLQKILQGKYTVVEYRGVFINSFGDYVAGSEKFESEDEIDIGNFCWDYELDQEAPDQFLNKPPGGVVVKSQDKNRFVYVFK